MRVNASRMFDQPHDERRRHHRRNIRLEAAAYVLCNSDVRAIKVWTRNLSDGGVCIMSHDELLGERMLLDLPYPSYQGMLIECEVRHRSRNDRLKIDGEHESTFVCGLKFGRVLFKDDVHETLLEAFHRLSRSTAEMDAVPSPGEPSLMPLLSAIGILVVYLSQLPWA